LRGKEKKMKNTGILELERENGLADHEKKLRKGKKTNRQEEANLSGSQDQ
jgi:hypothetical protein